MARLYETLIGSDHRRALGQYRTLPDISDLMRSWAARGTSTILDPGLGAGALSTPYHPDWHLSTDPDHAIGIDRSQLSRLMGTTALSIAGQPHDARATDFLDLSPAELSDDVDAIVANPPYTDSQTLSTEDKRSYCAAAQRATGRDIDAKTPLHGYFIYHSREFLADHDRMATITPQAWLATDYGRTLKRFVLDEFRVQALVLLNPETISAFDGPMATGLIALLEADSDPNPDNTVRFIRIDDLSELETADGNRDWQPVRDLVHGDATDAGDWGIANAVRQGDLSPERNWQARFDPVDIDTRDLPSLGDFVSVTRGPTTGNVGFFCLNETDVADARLDREHLSKIVRRPSHIDGYDYREADWQTARAEGKDVWLFDPDEIPSVSDSIAEFSQRVTNHDTDPDFEIDDADSDLIAYLQTGVTEHDLTGTRTLEARQYWYRPRRKDPAEVLVQSSGRDGFKFVLNEAAVRNTNACYGFYDIELTNRELKALLAYLNSDLFADITRQYRHTLDDGFHKIEPNDLEQVPVIDPTDLSNDTLTLAEAFDELRMAARQGRDCSDVLNRIDCVLEQIL
ncbi:TaqI-like C-terminal specificity domain-containing protein [Halorubrum sp. F4]|uniref:Eco57I restriction-modification methylase domain-containing protein n=1 Tax=Halorubrum sp. F4 TaxID=2989715 RepID=UPI002480F829|nr:TaqI-like C-terminal specificity domain-containing protein [Halorubrum sp. F4]